MLLARYPATDYGAYRVYPYVNGEFTPSECHASMSRIPKMDTVNKEWNIEVSMTFVFSNG